MKQPSWRILLTELLKLQNAYPQYKVISGPGGKDGLWTIAAHFRSGKFDRLIATGQARRKSDAKQRAAYAALHAEHQVFQELLWKHARTRGSNAEELVINLINDPPGPRPDWILRAEPPTREQDQNGIDVIVRTTDDFRLFIQVKTSEVGRLKYEKKYPNAPVAIVVVTDADSDAIIYHDILYALKRLRKRRLTERKAAT